jgi:hypothetical protein
MLLLSVLIFIRIILLRSIFIYFIRGKPLEINGEVDILILKFYL